MTERVLEGNTTQKKERETYKQNKKKLRESLNKMYAGADLFEGTTPAPAAAAGTAQGPLSGVNSSDKGIDISGIPGMNNWKHLIK